MATTTAYSLDFTYLSQRYREGSLRPTQLIHELYLRIEGRGSDDPIWIYLLPMASALAQAERLEDSDPTTLPLYGLPFAVKDNINVAGLPTTAGCPDFAYTAEVDAPVVRRLLDAGAILIGKTNLDQFATGLVGVRSPYGACRNPFDPRYIAGGSSSGSAVAVATGLVSFALGTDTAGSGRVPAALTNTVGLKPSRGLISTEGVVPACRSLDCVSIQALTVEDAETVLNVVALAGQGTATASACFRFGIPRAADLVFFDDSYNPSLFHQAVEALVGQGGTPVEIDLTPFREAAALLYDGPWVAERYAAIKDFFDVCPDSLLPVTRAIIGKGQDYSAVHLFQALYRLEALKAEIVPLWRELDLLVVPSVPTLYTLDEVAAEPVELNSRLGYYTNFVNLLDLCALALPAALRPDGLPFGITLIASAGHDRQLASLGVRYQRARGLPLGATGKPLPVPPPTAVLENGIQLAVVGAHLSGQPLNHQLTKYGARLLRTTRTAPHYRFYALSGTSPPKPGLVCLPAAAEGAAIEVEIWELDAAAFGRLVATIPPPLGIGTLVLEDGNQVKGFLCESYAVATAQDISAYGGWRNFLAASNTTPANS